MERNLRQIHRRLDDYERELSDYYAVARGDRPSAPAQSGEAASRPGRAA